MAPTAQYGSDACLRSEGVILSWSAALAHLWAQLKHPPGSTTPRGKAQQELSEFRVLLFLCMQQPEAAAPYQNKVTAVSSILNESTSAGLLDLLRNPARDPEAWDRFVQRYGGVIHRWSRQWGLQAADADDVTQTVFVKLVRELKTFTYDKSKMFRCLLKAIVNSTVKDLLKSAQRRTDREGKWALDHSRGNQSAEEDLLDRLEQEFQLELLQMAVSQARLMEPRAKFTAFQLLKIEGKSAAEASKQLNLTESSVRAYAYQVKERIKRMIRNMEAQQPPFAITDGSF